MVWYTIQAFTQCCAALCREREDIVFPLRRGLCKVLDALGWAFLCGGTAVSRVGRLFWGLCVLLSLGCDGCGKGDGLK